MVLSPISHNSQPLSLRAGLQLFCIQLGQCRLAGYGLSADFHGFYKSGCITYKKIFSVFYRGYRYAQIRKGGFILVDKSFFRVQVIPELIPFILKLIQQYEVLSIRRTGAFESVFIRFSFFVGDLHCNCNLIDRLFPLKQFFHPFSDLFTVSSKQGDPYNEHGLP